jgi:ferredoxin-NADP reductase
MKESTQKVIVKSIKHITHDVLQIVTEKPQKYTFTPGQATAISLSESGWKDEKRPFTFTSLPDSNFLEFTIKVYPSHKGVTNELLQLRKNDTLILHEVFGAIEYKGEGVFIAGGSGITPFISILRDLHLRNKIGNNKLIFANKTKGDIILYKELKKLLSYNFINILSDENIDGFATGLISESFLKAHLNSDCKNVYVCGPPQMMESIETILQNLNVDKDSIVKEVF